MKIFIPARHGFGDVLSGYFVNNHNNNLLAKLRIAYQNGLVSEIILAYEGFMNPAIAELFSNLDFPVKPVSTSHLSQWTKVADHNNNFPLTMGEYINLLTNTPKEISELDTSYLLVPQQKPKIDLSEDFILFSGYAGESDRFLKSPEIINSIKENSSLPIVSVGKALSRNGLLGTPLQGDIALENKLSIVETLWLMSKAKCIISPLTFFRCASTLFNQRVFELVENPSRQIIDRTNQEYKESRFGINDSTSWYQWPLHKSIFVKDFKIYMDNI